jgi:uncharacterized damage-inducible protein DinB
MDTAQQFLNRSAQYLRDDYLPKIKEAVELLDDLELWLRESDAANSIGNLILHLAGNVRQHIIAGVGQREEDHRDRAAEFSAVGGLTKIDLIGIIEGTVLTAAEVLDELDPAELSTTRVIQESEVLLLDDIYHVVEHFAYHTGQIIYIVKAMKDHKFPWYNYLEKTV